MARISPRSPSTRTARRDDRFERWLGWLALPLAGALFATQAEGATLTVQANVVGACSVSDNVLGFTGDYISGQPEDLDGTVTVDVNCSNGLTVDVKLGTGNDPVGDDRVMTNGQQILRYNLFKTAARSETDVWGDGTFATPKRVNTWDQTSHGQQVIHGRIYGGQAVASDDYNDLVPLTVEVIPTAQ